MNSESEISLFTPVYKTAVITGLHYTGQIEFMDETSKDVFLNDTVQSLTPIKLTQMTLPGQLRKSEFIWISSFHAVFTNKTFVVTLKEIVLKDKWIINFLSSNCHANIDIYFFHELQNAFYFFTKTEI